MRFAARAPRRVAAPFTSPSSACRPRTHARRRVNALTDAALESQTIQAQLLEQLQDLNRGIFGVQSEKKQAIHGLIERLETLNPLAQPAAHLEQVEGTWELLYSTITIMGTKRSKLGLREFVKIGDMQQSIDVASARAVNTVAFSVTGFGLVKGQLRITASFQPVTDSRVAVTFEEAVLEPEQLQKLFQKHYAMLLSIFNPDGWLDITYVDARFRVGRDSNGNVFLLRRADEPL